MACSAEKLEYFVGDRLPEIFVTYYYYDDNDVKQAVDLTGYQAFELHINMTTPKSQSGTVVVATEGTFKFPFDAGFFDEAGIFTSEIMIRDDNGLEITYPFVEFDVTERIYP